MNTKTEIQELFKVSELSAAVLSKRFQRIEDIEKAVFPKKVSTDFDKLFEEEIRKTEELLSSSQSVFVYSDYDADGLMSLRILKHLLQKNFNKEDIYTFVNERTQGYGILPEAVKEILEVRPDVLITADLGSTTPGSILRELQRHDIKVIITDHHTYLEKPHCDVFINPFGTSLDYYTGAGVVTRTLSRRQPLEYKTICEMSIAAVADSAPLLYDNRYFVKQVIEKNEWPRWVDAKEIKDAQDIAFQIVPKINAVSRVGSVKEYLAVIDDDDRAKEYANRVNEKRRELMKTATRIGFAQAYQQTGREIIVADLPPRYYGLHGIVASRLCGAFRKPALVGHSTEYGTFKASARDFFSKTPLLHILQRAKDTFRVTHIGGHVAAFGCEFSVKSRELTEIIESVNLSDFEHLVKEEEKVEEAQVDLYMTAEEVIKNYEALKKMCRELSPFGSGFPPVSILVSGVDKVIAVKDDKVFLRLPQVQERLYNVDIDSMARSNAIILKVSGTTPRFEAEDA